MPDEVVGRPEPTPSAWRYFNTHRDNIRAVVEQFMDKDKYSMDEFDQAVKDTNVALLTAMMNNAWFHAPDERAVYRIPGFTNMCNLLDETVEGFLGEPEYEDEDDPEDEDK